MTQTAATLPVSSGALFQRRRWTRAEYHKMLEAGILRNGDPFELIDGEVVLKVTTNPPHVTAVILAGDRLREAFGPGHVVRIQVPMAVGASEPEPDVAVVPGDPNDYDDHPSTALLVVEVADSSLAADRTVKASLYASADVPDYWITNLVHRQIEVHREPVEGADAPFGRAYRSVVVYRPGQSIRPLRAPAAEIAVDALLPRQR